MYPIRNAATPSRMMQAIVINTILTLLIFLVIPLFSQIMFVGSGAAFASIVLPRNFTFLSLLKYLQA